jgi:hypothetical protein
MRPRGATLACILQLMIACGPDTGQSTAEAPFVGTWDLVSITTQWPDGRETTPWGIAPIGRLSYGVDGRMTAVLMDAARNQADGRAVSPEHQANVASYYGGFTIDTARRVVRHRVAASMRAAESGILEREYEFQGDTLILRAAGTLEGQSVTHTLVWRRGVESLPAGART